MLWVTLLAVCQALQSQLPKLKDNNSDGVTIKQCLQEKDDKWIRKATKLPLFQQNFHSTSVSIQVLQCAMIWYDMKFK